jgi:hypothetical protein
MMNTAQTNRRLLHSQLLWQDYDSQGRGLANLQGASQIPSIRGSISRREEIPSKQAKNIELFRQEHIHHKNHMMNHYTTVQASRLLRYILLYDRPALQNQIPAIHLSTGETSTRLHYLLRY